MIGCRQCDTAHVSPWVTANILDDHGQPLFPQWISKKVQGVQILITDLSAPPKNGLPGAQVAPWESILPKLLAQLTQESKDPFIILLSSLSSEENRLIAEKYSAINLLLGAGHRHRNASPRLINNTLVTQTEKQGQYQGLLEINFGKQRIWGQDREKQIADLQNKLGSLNWQLRRLEKKSANSTFKEKYANTIERLHKDREKLNAKISSLQKALAQDRAQDAPTDYYQYRFIGLKKNLPNDVETDKMLQSLNQQVRQLHKKSRNRRKTSDGSSSLSPGYNLVGFQVCKSCHLPQTEFWQTTRHATAYSTLTKKEKNLDLECLPCHVTRDLFSTSHQPPSKEHLLSLPSELQSVSCENCHGAGKKHSVNPEQFKMSRRPGKEICLACHTPEHDDDFDYNTKLIPISCPAG